MNKLLGVSICWLLRRHRWRRPHKKELWDDAKGRMGILLSTHRVCVRCGSVREVRRRK